VRSTDPRIGGDGAASVWRDARTFPRAEESSMADEQEDDFDRFDEETDEQYLMLGTSSNDDEENEFEKLIGDRNVAPVMPLRNTVVFPRAVTPLRIGREANLELVRHVMEHDRVVACFMQKNAELEHPLIDDLHEIGTLAVVIRVQQTNDGFAHALLHGVSRVRRGEVVSEKPYLRANLSRVVTTEPEGLRSEALLLTAQQQMERLRAFAPDIPVEVVSIAKAITTPGRLADLLASLIQLEAEEAQALLAETDGRLRLEHVIEKVERQLHVLAVGKEIRDAAQKSLEERQTEVILREQLEAIQERLGEGDDSQREIADLEKKLEALDLPQDARKEVDRELSRLSRIPAQSPEYGVARTYLEWMAELPWGTMTQDLLDLRRAKHILDEDHYGLDEVKDRILEHLAVLEFRGDAKAPILCFVGPPGTGKTSLGRSIATALGRKFVRQSLGGVHDEAEIRGHRRTYVGAMPGKIVQALRRAGSSNPVIMLDEIDKVGRDVRGDPYSALLEVLDPAQNDSFMDHYINVPVDLSKVMFICTANVLDAIPGPLRDRTEVIALTGYTPQEKLEIARRHLIPRVLDDLGLGEHGVFFESATIELLIDGYTREPGLRGLERQVRSLLRKLARRLAEAGPSARAESHRITPDLAREFLGHEKYTDEDLPKPDEPGTALGLAWTPVGGEVLTIEAVAVPGKRRMILTGQLGDIMKESVSAAMTWVRAHAKELDIDEKRIEGTEVHLHVPAGAIPKDGPSAGVAMCSALVSLFTGRLPREGVAMTGEMTLRGRLLPVGGIKHKVLGAHRMGLHTVVLPRRNEHDLEDVPSDVRDELRFVFADHVFDALDCSLEPRARPPEPPRPPTVTH
jgi:ATP-dependent Lon protease